MNPEDVAILDKGIALYNLGKYEEALIWFAILINY